MGIIFKKGVLCSSNYNDMEHKPAVDGVELNENTTKADLDLATIYNFRGQVNTYNDLANISDPQNGDVYNVIDTGRNFAWDETNNTWDDIGGVRVTEVKDANNVSFVNGETATIPTATANQLGLVKSNPNNGVSVSNDGKLNTAAATDNDISERTQEYKPIVPKKLDLAVKTSITDNKLTLTNAEKDSARSWLDAQKVMQYETMPAADSVTDEIVQYVGETTSSYTKGYFYKSVAHASPYLHPIFEISPKAGTVVTISDENFHSFVESILPNPNEVTHGHIGYYSATSYSITLYYNNTFKYVVYEITDLEFAGFTFTPLLATQDGLDFTCGEFIYAWERISTQPVTVNNNAPDENGNITIDYSDVGAVEANAAITGATHTKITYDSKGLVTSGEDITLSDVTDVTATVTEVNYLSGVTSAVQTQLNGKQATLSGTAGQVVYTTDTAGTVTSQSVTDFSYVVTDADELTQCEASAPTTALICNLVDNKVYQYSSGSWVQKAGVTPMTQIGAGRFSYNAITTKLFFCTGTQIIHLATATLDAGNID